MNIWTLVLLAVALVLVSILVFRLHAFLTLLLAGLLVAALTGNQAVKTYTDGEVAKEKMTVAEAEKLLSNSALITAPTRLTVAFGNTVGKIGILIALASIIGQCLLQRFRSGFYFVAKKVQTNNGPPADTFISV